MPRKAKAWNRKGRGWYFSHHGSQIKLHDDEATAKKLLGIIQANPDSHPNEIINAYFSSKADYTVAQLCDDMVEHKIHTRSKSSVIAYKKQLKHVVDALGHRPAWEVLPAEITAIYQPRLANGQWKWRTVNSFIIRVKATWRWGSEQHGKTNPMASLKCLPEQRESPTIVDDERMEAFLAACKAKVFRDLCMIAFDSGVRPMEAHKIHAKHIDREKRTATLKAHDGAKGGITRTIYFASDRAWERVLELCEQYPEGRIFRNTRGKPWTSQALSYWFGKVEEELGWRINSTALRHSWITKMLRAGVDSHVVAKLAGHTSTAMIDKVYSHVAEDHDFMFEQAKKGLK